MPKTPQYISINKIEGLPIVELKSAMVFEDLYKQYKPEHILVELIESPIDTDKDDLITRTKNIVNSTFVGASEYSQSYFAFIENGICYKVAGQGFKTLEQLKAANKKGFVYGDDFYNAEKLGITEGETYNLFRKTGFKEKESFDIAEEKGFLGAVTQLNKLFADGKLLAECYAPIKPIKKDADLFEMSQLKGYADFEEFKQAALLGFANYAAADYKTALKQGAVNAKEYYEARNKSFNSITEFRQAQKIGIDNKFEYDQFNALTNVVKNKSFAFIDQAHVYQLIKSYELDTEISFDILHNALNAEKDRLKIKAPSSNRDWLNVPISKILKSNALPAWYTVGLKSKEEIRLFIVADKNLQSLGKFDLGNEIFKRSEKSIK